MSIRLNKVTRDLNVGITTVVEFLQKKGFTVEANPNTKVTDEQYDLLVKEFSTDKDLKKKTERFLQERQNKERNKASVAIDGYDKPAVQEKEEEVAQTTKVEDLRPKFKPVGKIDLDNLGKKPVVKAEEPKPEEKPVVVEQPVEQPVKEEPKPDVKPVVVEQPVEEPVKEEPKPEVKPVIVEQPVEEPVKEEQPEEEQDGVFQLRKPEFVSKINVIGQIDLADHAAPDQSHLFVVGARVTFLAPAGFGNVLLCHEAGVGEKALVCQNDLCGGVFGNGNGICRPRAENFDAKV